MPKKTQTLRRSDSSTKKAVAKAGGNRKPEKGASPAKVPSGTIRTAGELGIKAGSIGIRKGKAKTHKGRKILESKEPQLFEGAKKSIFVRGKKCSESVLQLMKDLHIQRGNDLSKLFLRTGRDIHPFDDPGQVESMASKQSCALFVCGTH